MGLMNLSGTVTSILGASLLAGCVVDYSWMGGMPSIIPPHGEAGHLTRDSAVAPYEQISFREPTGDKSDVFDRNGNAYELHFHEKIWIELQFMPLARADWYLVELVANNRGVEDGPARLVLDDLLAHIDLTNQVAEIYKVSSEDTFARNGLQNCNGIIGPAYCIIDLEQYIAWAMTVIDGGAEPDARYLFSVK